jgi:hypothetical protein
VVLPAALAAADEARDDIGTDRANEADEVAEDLVVPPSLQCFLDAERVAEVHRAGEELFRAVEPVRRGQFLRTQDAERLEDLGTDLVLPPVAARGRHQHRAHPLAQAQLGQQRVVLVVRMRRRLHVGADGVQLAQHQPERDLAGMLANGLDAQLRRQRDAAREREEEDDGDRESVADDGSGRHGWYRTTFTDGN